MSEILDQLRQAIRDGDVTRYRIAQDTGIAESVLSRFMSGERGLSIESVEVLAEYLGYELTLRRQRTKGR